MFGRVAGMLDKNAVIFLSLAAAVLLLAGLCLAITAPPARAQPSPHRDPSGASLFYNELSR
jgi:hypothetical protein